MLYKISDDVGHKSDDVGHIGSTAVWAMNIAYFRAGVLSHKTDIYFRERYMFVGVGDSCEIQCICKVIATYIHSVRHSCTYNA